MAGPVPAIDRGTLPLRMAGTRLVLGRAFGPTRGPAMTVRAGFIQGGSADVRCKLAMTIGLPLRAPSGVLRGILLMCAGVSVFPFMNVAVKLLAPHYPAAQITWA